MSGSVNSGTGSHLRKRLLQAVFWLALVSVLWSLDTLTKIHYRARIGSGLDNWRLFLEQGTSAAGVLAMIALVAWWLNHFPIRRESPLITAAGHVLGSIVFSLGHYTVMIVLRVIFLTLKGLSYTPPASLLSNLVFEYQKDVKIYLGIVAVITIYRLYLGGENRLQLRPRSKDKILVQTGSGEVVLNYENIDYLEAARNYVVVHSGDKEYLVRNTMTGLLESLAAERFARTHRSFAVNVAKVAEIRAVDSSHEVRLVNGRTVPLSRSLKDDLRRRLAGEETDNLEAAT